MFSSCLYKCYDKINIRKIYILNVFIYSGDTIITEYICPYCPRTSLSPGGIRFHVKLTHPEKFVEFETVFLPDLSTKFKKEHPDP